MNSIKAANNSEDGQHRYWHSIRRKDIRSVWTDEARDFTPWLAKPENMKILSDTLGID